MQECTHAHGMSTSWRPSRLANAGAPPASTSAADIFDPLQARWAFDTSAWAPGEQEWALLMGVLSEEERARTLRMRQPEDRKRALVSRLLQRRAAAALTGLPSDKVVIKRTKGGKPFLANRPAVDRYSSVAPNWNYNVSHEGSYVIFVSEPLMLCGADVAAPGALRPGRRSS